MIRKLLDIFGFLLENVPAILTVVFAAFVLLRSQQAGITQEEMLAWILTLLGLLATSELVERFRRLRRIEDTSREARDLLTDLIKEGDSIRQLGIRALHPTREFSCVLELTSSVSGEIWLLGSTIYTTLNLIRGPLIETLVATNCNLRVLLSAPDSPFLKEKEDEERIPGKNQAEVVASLAILQEIIEEVKSRGYKGLIEVRQYQRIAYFSLYIFDRRVALCSFYSFGRRSVELPMLEVESISEGAAGTLFRMYDEHYRQLWSDHRTTVVMTSQAEADIGNP
jgi:hypothetical protein